MAKNAKTYSIRNAARYLQDNGVDIGELRVRTLARQHEIFVNDPNTAKSTVGDSEREEWRIGETALIAYVKAVKSGTVRAASSGAKAYRINLDAAQLQELIAWAKVRNIAEPVRANKAYTPKPKGENGTADAVSVDALMTDEDEDEGQAEPEEMAVEG